MLNFIDQYLFRMDTQSREMTDGEPEVNSPHLQREKKAPESKIQVLKDKSLDVGKAAANHLQFRIERVAVLFVTTLAFIPHFLLLPLSFIATPLKKLPLSHPFTKIIKEYDQFVNRHLALILEILPSIASPTNRPTFFATNALALGKFYRSRSYDYADQAKALECYRAIEKRNPEGLYQQTKMMEKGIKPSPQTIINPYDIITNYRNLEKYPKAAYHLGLIYNRGGQSVKENNEEAYRYLRQASDAGVAKATFKLGTCFIQKRYEVPEQSNHISGMELYEKAMKQGSLRAQITLGNEKINHGNSKEVLNEGIALIEDVANRRSDYSEYACFELAKIFSKEAKKIEESAEKKENGEKGAMPAKAKAWYQKAIKCYEKVAQGLCSDRKSNKTFNKNHRAEACWNLGTIAYRGLYGEQEDKQKALQFFEGAADLNPKYRYDLAEIFRRGEQYPRDLEKAKQLYQALPLSYPGREVAIEKVEEMKNLKDNTIEDV